VRLQQQQTVDRLVDGFVAGAGRRRRVERSSKQPSPVTGIGRSGRWNATGWSLPLMIRSRVPWLPAPGFTRRVRPSSSIPRQRFSASRVIRFQLADDLLGVRVEQQLVGIER
jgi:hypothetical protein